MANQEGAGRGILGIIAPQRERTAPPVLPKPETRPAPVSAEPKRRKDKKGIGAKTRIALASLAVAGAGVGAYESYENIPPVHRAVDSAFLDHLKGKSSLSEASTDVFDNTATKGVITEKNTIQTTREEYAKIAPPVINRENVQKVPVEFAIPGGKRNLTFERGTSVNAMIYIKTADGQIRDVTYAKIIDPGKVTGDVFPNCEVFVGEKNEIQTGNIFPSPISGFVYHSGTPRGFYKGEKMEEGSVNGAAYRIEGEYVDKEGNKFRTHASIYTLGLSGSAITKPLVPGIPNSEDFVEGNVSEGWITNTEKLNNARIKVNQGDDLFKFITQPPFQDFSLSSKKKSQVRVILSYEGNIGKNGIANTFGGENCIHPTLDNKAIVLK